MNRVKPVLFSLTSLFAVSLALFQPQAALAQKGLRATTLPKSRGPIVNFHAQLPKGTTLKQIKGTRAGSFTAQTVDITPNTTAVDDRNPYWSKDEQFVIFQSNRADLTGTTAGTNYHLYRSSPDGSNLVAITGPLAASGIGATTQQTEAAYNPGTSAIIYIDTDASGLVDLRELNSVTGISTSILKQNPQGFSFNALNHPEYGFAIGGNIGVIFSGKRNIDNNYHLFTVDTQKGIVTQLTSAGLDDKNPTISPSANKPVIAFDRGPTGGKHDIYVTGTSQNGTVTQVTNFAVGGNSSDNLEPSWSTDKTDQPQPGGNPIINGRQLLGFASTRLDTANDGNANAIAANGTHDIYYLRVTIGPDPNNNGTFTITNPEGPQNGALKLVTSDKSHIYDDRRPTWPQFINTYRVIYQSDRSHYDPVADANGLNASGPAGQPNDLFASTLVDVNSPALVRFDDVSGDIVSVTPRIAAPGSTVRIAAKLADFETGIRDVWAQIKNPNSKYQSADNKEHKVFAFYFLDPEGSNIIRTPVEYEMQRIFIGDGSSGTPNTYADPIYTASIDDFFAYSGVFSPPDTGWLKLNFVSRDAVTGASTFAANWTTDNFPSDYVIDIIAYDNAINPFSPSQKSNWKIYDNVWGFTTASFQAKHGLLFVSDNAAGQKFFGGRFGNLSLTNVYNTFWGTESWMTDIDTSLFGKSWRPKTGGTGGPTANIMNGLGARSYGSQTEYFGSYDPLDDDGSFTSDFESLPPTGQYDMWRTLCRGPLPDAVLQQYGTHTESQPPDTISGEKTPRSVVVAPRCVIWHAPFAGSIFTGPGSITDLNVQNQLHNFLTGGGRLIVNGQDIGWSLTLDGASSNPFYTNDLKAQYVSDAAGAFSFVVAGGFFPTVEFISGAYTMTSTGQYDPITHDPWRNTNKIITIGPGHRYAGPPFPDGVSDYVSRENEYIIAGPDPISPRDMASFAVGYPDLVTSLAPAIVDMKYATGQTGIHHYTDPTTGARVMYCAFGLEGLAPDTFAIPNTNPSVLALKNRRSEILHNATCWMRTGTIFGTVRDVEAGAPLANVLVRIYNKTNATGQPIIAYTGLTGSDGSYIINGVEADEYVVTAFKPGFTIQKSSGQQVHGGFRSDISFKMSKAETAVITGKITRADGVTAVVGATVSAKDNNDPTAPVLTATSDINGNYSISRVPAQTTYTLTATAVGFGASSPLSYQVPNPNDPIVSQRDLTVVPAKTYAGFDFIMKADKGSVTGGVFVKNPDGSKGSPIANAQVTGTVLTDVETALTDSNGAYSFDKLNAPPNGLDPGTASLVATAPGYAPNVPVTATVTSNTTVVAPDILLSPVPPGSISGLVTRSSDNSALAGVLIQLSDGSGTVITSTTTTNIQADGTNYRISSVPAGVTYTVTATKNGFTANPLTRSALVASGVETTGVNFSMEPLHTFAASLSLISAPYDYGSNPANVKTLLGVPDSDTAFLFATWDAGAYKYFPTPPADRFRLGRGYFLGYRTNLPLSLTGTPADTTRPYDIPLTVGWNMIGDPFLFGIDWTKVKVVDGGAVLSHDQALASGAIGGGLYSYVSGSYILDFQLTPWRGYWVKAYRPVTLRIDPATDGYGRAAALNDKGASRAVLQGGNGWGVNMRLTVGDLHDDNNYLGESSRAADAFDQFKMEKPPLFGDRYASLTFSHADWGNKNGSYGVDVRSASAGSKSWDILVETSAVNSRATITWPNMAVVSRNTVLVLTDTVTGSTVDMRSASSYSWNTGDTPAPRKLRVDAVRADGNSLRITNVVARQAGSRAAGVTIGYSLSASASVEVKILGASGGVVRRLTGRATRAAGLNETTWDQKTDTNTSVPSGLYTVEIKAQSLDGRTTVRQLGTVVVTR